ncbi:MAG TPA: delta-60 repeat domain-containing protein [Kofleriaceae bacterium]|nr:delta-60 repeat domain-containing protein [Kofleriaceae bacterium]
MLGIATAIASVACGEVSHGDGDGADSDDDGGAQTDDDGGDGGGDGGDVKGFAVDVAVERLFLRQGQTAALEVTISREDGFDTAVTVELRDLPAGVTAEPATAQPGGGRAIVMVSAASDATQGALGVEAVGKAGDVERRAAVRLVVAGEPGTLDQSFAGGGVFTYQLAGLASTGRGLAIQPDGKIVMTGGAGGQAVTIRLDADGALDDSFGSGGAVSTGVGPQSRGAVVTLAPEGRILVGADVSGSAGPDVGLVAYTPAGELDGGFGSAGTVVVDTPVGVDDVRKVLVLGSGELLTVARAEALGKDFALQVTRHSAAGVLDAGFGLTQQLYSPAAAFLDREGRLALAGIRDGLERLTFVDRFLPDGTPDESFSEDGVVETDIAPGAIDGATGLIELDGGKLLATGFAAPDAQALLALARYNPNGSLDLTFGDGGVLVTPTPFDPADSLRTTVGGAEAVLVAGREPVSGLPAVMRLLGDGSADPSFGDGGLATVDAGLPVTIDSGVDGIAIDGDGRIVASGSAGMFETTSYVVARLWP